MLRHSRPNLLLVVLQEIAEHDVRRLLDVRVPEPVDPGVKRSLLRLGDLDARENLADVCACQVP